MPELVQHNRIRWQQLAHLESPLMVQNRLILAVNAHKNPAMILPPGNIRNFGQWLVNSRAFVLDAHRYATQSLNAGDSYFVCDQSRKPILPLLYWEQNKSAETSTPLFGENGSWAVSEHVQQPLRNKLLVLLENIKPPKPTVVRQLAVLSKGVSGDTVKNKISRYMVQLEIEAEPGTMLPDRHPVNLIVMNTSQDKKSVQQTNDVIWDQESNVFRVEQGDSIEIFAVTEHNKIARDDFLDNKNFSASIAAKKISPLEITSTYNRSDDVTVHTAKYVVPNKFVEISLFDEDGMPDDGAPYQIYDLDGQLYEKGRLDENGYARVEGIEGTDVDIRFP